MESNPQAPPQTPLEAAKMSELTLQERALIQAHGGGNVVVIRPEIVRALGGDGNAAILLSQFIYWAVRSEENNGWFYDTQAELQEQTGLSVDTQQRCRTKFWRLGLGEEKKTGNPGKLYYRLDLKAVVSFISKAENRYISDSGNLRNKNRRTSETRIGEPPKLYKDKKTQEETQEERGAHAQENLPPTAAQPNGNDQHADFMAGAEGDGANDVARVPRIDTAPPPKATAPHVVESHSPQQPNSRTLIDINNPNEPAYHTPHFKALLKACRMNFELMDTATRINCASRATKLSKFYTPAQIIQIGENCPFGDPSPQQICNNAESWLNLKPKAHPQIPQPRSYAYSADETRQMLDAQTREFDEIARRNAARQAAQ